MYIVLDKDTIISVILPHLSIAKRGFVCKANIVEVVNCILYKLKTGIQWSLLPVRALCSDVVLSCKTVFYHFRKRSKNGEWKSVWIALTFAQNKQLRHNNAGSNVKIILNTYLIITSLHTNCNEPEIKEQNCWEYQELSYFGEIVN